jgi:hypothetical protein
LQSFGRRPVFNSYEVGVQEVSEDDQNDRSKFYFQKCKFDLVCSGISADCVLHFLMQNDTKANGKVKSFQDMRKHRDAMRWRSKAADE